MIESEVLTQETSDMRLTYAQIADDMEARIRAGEYPPNSRLPSYRELAEMYSVGVSTAARAFGLLRDRRLTVGEPGRAVYVVAKLPR